MDTLFCLLAILIVYNLIRHAFWNRKRSSSIKASDDHESSDHDLIGTAGDPAISPRPGEDVHASSSSTSTELGSLQESHLRSPPDPLDSEIRTIPTSSTIPNEPAPSEHSTAPQPQIAIASFNQIVSAITMYVNTVLNGLVAHNYVRRGSTTSVGLTGNTFSV
jgi:hypothetical protein